MAEAIPKLCKMVSSTCAMQRVAGPVKRDHHDSCKEVCKSSGGTQSFEMCLGSNGSVGSTGATLLEDGKRFGVV